MASSVYSGKDDEYLIGSDSADEIYKPVVLKTFKHGIDTVTSIAFGNNEQFGYYALVCYSNKQLTLFSDNGDFKKNVRLQSLLQIHRYFIRDISWIIDEQSVFTVHNEKGGSSFHSYMPSGKDIKHSGDFAVIPDESLQDQTNHIITGICLLKSENKYRNGSIVGTFAVCYVDEMSYETTSNSRRYVMEVEMKPYHNTYTQFYSDLGRMYQPYPIPSNDQNTTSNNNLIEFKDEDTKERYFTFPKRITVSNLGDKWIIDRKSPSSGDVKVFQSNVPPLLKFVYRGNPGSTFDPMDIKPSQDAMVISDCSNHNVHLVKNDGTFLMHVMTGGQGLQYPRALCVDVFDRIWVGCNDGTIRILKYRTEFEP